MTALPLSPVPEYALDPAVPVPWPAGAGTRLALVAGDRVVTVLMVMQQPSLLVLEGLLSDAECQALLAAAAPRLSRSLTVAWRTGGEEESGDRTSRGALFERGETDLIQRIEARIASLLSWPVEHGEGLQVLRYGLGAEYKPHYDYFDPAAAGTPRLLKRGGQRSATLIIDLQEPEAGGATIFPEAQFEVNPRRGNAVFFNYERAHPVSRTCMRVRPRWQAKNGSPPNGCASASSFKQFPIKCRSAKASSYEHP